MVPFNVIRGIGDATFNADWSEAEIEMHPVSERGFHLNKTIQTSAKDVWGMRSEQRTRKFQYDFLR